MIKKYQNLILYITDGIVKSNSTSDFIENWSTGVDSFAVYAANSVLIVDEIEEQEQDTTIAKLFNPNHDFSKKTLKYDIILENLTLIELQKEFE